jgi:hypothetical protein
MVSTSELTLRTHKRFEGLRNANNFERLRTFLTKVLLSVGLDLGQEL